MYNLSQDKKLNNDLNVFTYGYMPWGYIPNWPRNVKQFFRNLKYAWQRARYGYCSQDTWNLDNYYTCLIRDSVNYLAEHTCGYPGDETEEGKTPEAWTAYLKNIALLMDKSIEREFEDFIYYPNEYEKKYQAYLDDPMHFQFEDLPNGHSRLVNNDTPADIELRENYFKNESQIYKLRVKDREQAISMLLNRWDSLWD